MTGEAHWIDPAIVFLGGMGVFALIWLGSRAQLLLRLLDRRVRCPATGKGMDCTLLHDARSNRVIDVKSCSAFANPRDVRCAKRCIEPGTLEILPRA
jgi:hypothetical protein